MGMFDYVSIKEPPKIMLRSIEETKFKDIDLTSLEFQTKTMRDDPGLQQYEIRGSKLYIEEYELEHVPESKRPYGEATDPLLRAMGSMKKAHKGWQEVREVHRIATIYSDDLEFELKFTDGNLVGCRVKK